MSAADWSQLSDLKAVGRHAVFRLPGGETRLYFDDGSYTSGAGGRFGELIAAGWVGVGPLFYAAPTRAQRNWRFLDLTGAGQRVVARAEAADAADSAGPGG